MKMYIPNIGDCITLTKTWYIKLFNERRNLDLLKFFEKVKDGIELYRKDSRTFEPVSLPAGTVLKIDRIYLRKGMPDYASVTFIMQNLGGKPITLEVERCDYVGVSAALQAALDEQAAKGIRYGVLNVKKVPPKKVTLKKLRFWAKLADVNQMEIK